ncbi:uncharacterized protein LOC110829670 isoform X2 [Zootermopsis nevadensis]|nr:uncharacterized protein LOC110829670 isoform X2 [Zootermopsis nevadensis]
MAAFATTILFLILTLIMVSVTLQSSYAWLVMGSTLFLFVTLCSYSSCEKTYWRRTTMHSDSVSTISDGHDNIEGEEYNRSILPYWITDLPPSYAAATSQQAEAVTGTISPYSSPPPYSTVVEHSSGQNSVTEEQRQHTSGNILSSDTLTLPPQCPSRTSRILLQDCGPPEHIHSLKIPSSVVRLSQSAYKHCNTLSLERRPAEH